MYQGVHRALDDARWHESLRGLEAAQCETHLRHWFAALGHREVLVLPTDYERVGVLRMHADDVAECALGLLDRDSLIIATADGTVGVVAQRFENGRVTYELLTWPCPR